MKIVAAIIFAVVIIIVVFMLIVLIPVIVGKLFFKWSKNRIKYILSKSLSSIMGAVVISLILTGLILLVGMVFKATWAFSGGLLIVYTLWVAIKSVIQAVKESKYM